MTALRPQATLHYSHNVNPRVAVAVAQHLELPLKFAFASPREPANRDDFSKLNPNAFVPVLQEADRTYWETDAIACRLSYLAKSNFWCGGEEQAEMIKWISWATHHLNRHADAVVWFRVTLPKFSNAPLNTAAVEEGLTGFREFGKVLDTALASRAWLVGDRLSYADFRVATFLPWSKEAGLPLDEFPNARRWYDQLLEVKAWRDPFGGL